MSLITTPFIFSFSLAVAFGFYYKDLSNIFGGVPCIAFQAYLIYFIAVPLLIYVFHLAKNSCLIKVIGSVIITALVALGVDQLFFQSDSNVFRYLMFGSFAGFVYFVIQQFTQKLISSKFSFIDDD